MDVTNFTFKEMQNDNNNKQYLDLLINLFTTFDISANFTENSERTV